MEKQDLHDIGKDLRHEAAYAEADPNDEAKAPAREGS